MGYWDAYVAGKYNSYYVPPISKNDLPAYLKGVADKNRDAESKRSSVQRVSKPTNNFSQKINTPVYLSSPAYPSYSSNSNSNSENFIYTLGVFVFIFFILPIIIFAFFIISIKINNSENIPSNRNANAYSNTNPSTIYRKHTISKHSVKQGKSQKHRKIKNGYISKEHVYTWEAIPN